MAVIRSTRGAKRLGLTGLCCALALASPRVRAHDTWSDLWVTPPQQAQRLLESGHPDRAARLFRDPKRRAYAELRAGRYDEAAKLLRPFEDPRSQYNRGNALAHVGNLRAALAAYDAALAKAPHDRDAIHNRDLVARELEQHAGGSGNRGSRGRPGHGGQSGRSGSAGGQGRSDASRNGASQSGKSRGSGTRGASGPGAAGAQAGSRPGAESPEQQAEQAREDAELATQLQRRGAKRGSRSDAGGTGSARAGASSGESVVPRKKPPGDAEDEGPPLSERTLALEQWLRRIPDDPGGLLRRKFLIEHLEREQRAQSESGSEDSQGSSP
jgi:Ca-activated chloride channel homolog